MCLPEGVSNRSNGNGLPENTICTVLRTLHSFSVGYQGYRRFSRSAIISVTELLLLKYTCHFKTFVSFSSTWYQALQSSVCANHVVYLQQARRAVSERPLFLQPRRTREATLDGTVSTADQSQLEFQLVFCPSATPTSSPTHRAHAQQKSIAVMFSSREEQKSSL